MIISTTNLHERLTLHKAHIRHWTPRLDRLRRNFDLLLHEGEGDRVMELMRDIDTMIRAKQRLVMVLSRHHMRENVSTTIGA